MFSNFPYIICTFFLLLLSIFAANSPNYEAAKRIAKRDLESNTAWGFRAGRSLHDQKLVVAWVRGEPDQHYLATAAFQMRKPQNVKGIKSVWGAECSSQVSHIGSWDFSQGHHVFLGEVRLRHHHHGGHMIKNMGKDRSVGFGHWLSMSVQIADALAWDR